MAADFIDYTKYDGMGLAELIRKKQVKPVELIEAAISRIERLNPQLNAVVYKMYEQAREAAKGDLPDGPFTGVPFLLKDLTAYYGGVPLTCASRFFQDFIPDHDSELVKRFKSAGVITIGKTNTPELGLSPVTEPELFGPANNPWDLTRTTGGSSGGSAAAVASRMVPLSHGNDGGGSIRIPSSCCGVFGLKPTRARTPAGPDHGDLWRGLVCEHVITRSVRDSAAMLDATAGADTGAPYYAAPPSRPFLSEVNTPPGELRIAFTSEPFFGDTVHHDCVKGLEATVKLCHELGHEVVEAAPQIDYEAVAEAYIPINCSEIRADIEWAEASLGRKATFKDFEPMTWVIYLLGSQYRGAEYSKALNLIQRVGRQIGEFFNRYDVLLTPTLAKPPLQTGTLQPKGIQALGMKLLGRLKAGSVLKKLINFGNISDEYFSFIPFTPLFNMTGQPAMSVPLYWNDKGLPIGMQFAGRYGDEATLFRLAGQLEEARPWADRLPPVCIKTE